VGAQPDRRAWPAAGLGLAALVCLWAAATYFSLRASGVTGSDPYAYVQMAVDLARHGSLLHTFPLAPQIAAWQLPTWPAVPVGYRPPDVLTGQAATVWAPGYAAFLALAYQLTGEPGLYLLPPLMGCLALAALWALCLEVLRAWPVERRHLAAGLAVLVLATSYRQLEGAALPMADIPSQLFTLLAVYGALRATRAGEGLKANLIWAALSGLCLAVAFSIRYTQVLLAVSLLFLLASRLRPVGASWRALALRLVAFGLAAWLGVLPVLAYHTVAFGHPFTVGSAELGLFGWTYIPATTLALARELLRTNEFLYLVPFLLWGLVRLGRGFGRELTVLVLWLGVLLAFHLPYPALRARDLLSVFPVLALWIGVGAADMLAWAFASGPIAARPSKAKTFGLRFLVLSAVILLFGARGRVTLQWPLHPAQFNTFGYLNARQRAALDEIQRLTPPEAVLAASLNSGALTLYSQRAAVRPGDWPPDDWRRFVQLALAQGLEVYVLLDGKEMQAPKQALEPAYTLKPVAELPLPYFYPDGSSDNRPVDLYQVTR
jgi:hypothetical protein